MTKHYKGQRVTHGTDENQPGTVISSPDFVECNPLIEILWDKTHKIEFIRSEYLYTGYVKQIA